MSIQFTHPEVQAAERERSENIEVDRDSVHESWLPSWDLIPRQRRRFVRGLIAEFEDIDTDSRMADIEVRKHLRDVKHLDTGTVGEIAEFRADLLVFPDETRLFVGDDPTSKEAVSLFGFTVGPNDPIPAPTDVQEGIDLLKPAGVKQALDLGTTEPQRQGEWWLLDTDETPAGSVFKPGVNERPFDGSPLGSHAPREYGLGVTDDEFMARFEESCPELADHVSTPHEAFDRIWQGWEIATVEGVELESDLPTLRDLRRLAERVYVRGTLRHRENEHYMESVGESWKIAQTHHLDVYTADNIAAISRVRRD